MNRDGEWKNTYTMRLLILIFVAAGIVAGVVKYVAIFTEPTLCDRAKVDPQPEKISLDVRHQCGLPEPRQRRAAPKKNFLDNLLD